MTTISFHDRNHQPIAKVIDSRYWNAVEKALRQREKEIVEEERREKERRLEEEQKKAESELLMDLMARINRLNRDLSPWGYGRADITVSDLLWDHLVNLPTFIPVSLSEDGPNAFGRIGRVHIQRKNT